MSRHECGHVWVCSTITTSPPITIYLGTEMETVAFEKRFWRIRGSWRRWIRRYQSPRVILATANRWRRCQKAKRGTEILHKHAAWSYGLQQQGTSWCRTYASWDGTNAEILSAPSRTSDDGEEARTKTLRLPLRQQEVREGSGGDYRRRDGQKTGGPRSSKIHKHGGCA